MTEIPEADAMDQARAVTPVATPEEPELDPEAPVADTVEQTQPVVPSAAGGGLGELDPEVPVADAVEQAQPLPPEDEEPPPG